MSKLSLCNELSIGRRAVDARVAGYLSSSEMTVAYSTSWYSYAIRNIVTIIVIVVVSSSKATAGIETAGLWTLRQTVYYMGGINGVDHSQMRRSIRWVRHMNVQASYTSPVKSDVWLAVIDRVVVSSYTIGLVHTLFLICVFLVCSFYLYVCISVCCLCCFVRTQSVIIAGPSAVLTLFEYTRIIHTPMRFSVRLMWRLYRWTDGDNIIRSRNEQNHLHKIPQTKGARTESPS